MRKIIIASSSILILLTIIFSISYTIKLDDKEININGTTYALTIDGEKVNSIPINGNYYLINYTCENGSVVTWDKDEHDLYIKAVDENGNEYIQIDSCTLDFSTNPFGDERPLLNTMKVGDYVAYEGDPNNGCLKGKTGTTGDRTAESGNSCKGENANQSIDDSGYTYGYCGESNYKFYVYGWRIAYIEDEKVHLISAGSPECSTSNQSLLNEAQINDLNTAALDYCNDNYVDGGVCSSSNTWSVGNEDFRKITYAISGKRSNLTQVYTSGDYDVSECLGTSALKECGYNNDLIDNGGSYYFAAYRASSGMDGVSWDPEYRRVKNFNKISSHSNYNGLRPIIKLSSSVYVTGGTGTMEDPYQIDIDTN